MACHPTHNGKGRALHPNFSDLEETGRLHFFYHSPSSQLPVRDVLDEQKHGYKTEPYIEKCAENYCLECYQDNIRGFCRAVKGTSFFSPRAGISVRNMLDKYTLLATSRKSDVNCDLGDFTPQLAPSNWSLSIMHGLSETRGMTITRGRCKRSSPFERRSRFSITSKERKTF